MKKGDAEIDGVTTDNKPRRLGPKRASYIRKVFALRKKDDVRKYVVRREVKKGDFVYLPPWCVHGIENTGTETLVVLIATSPPNP